MSRPEQLTAQQLVARYHEEDSLRVYIEQHAEHLTLGRRKPPRHAPAARYLLWTPQAIRDRTLARTNLAMHVLARQGAPAPHTGAPTNE
jgi:hypothetical protein